MRSNLSFIGEYIFLVVLFSLQVQHTDITEVLRYAAAVHRIVVAINVHTHTRVFLSKGN